MLAAGGDGTLHEVANGLLGSQTVLVPLPAGTTNCLTRDLGLPTPDGGDPHWLLTRPTAAGRHGCSRWTWASAATGARSCCGRPWGSTARIVERVEPRFLLKRFGMAGYVAKATMPFLSLPAHMRISVNNETIEGDFLNVTVCNTRLYAGASST